MAIEQLRLFVEKTATLLGDIACSPLGSGKILRGSGAAITCLALFGTVNAPHDSDLGEFSVSQSGIIPEYIQSERAHDTPIAEAGKPNPTNETDLAVETDPSRTITRMFAESITSTETETPEPVSNHALKAMQKAEEIILEDYPKEWRSDEQIESLVRLWWRESRWDHRVVNSESGAFGIAQSNPQSGAIMPKYNSANSQIKWGMRYIENRYGDPVKALIHSNEHGWY